MNNLFRKLLIILPSICPIVVVTTVYGAEEFSNEHTTCYHADSANKKESASANSDGLMKAGLLSRQAYKSAVADNYTEAWCYFYEAAARGDEFAIRYLEHSYKHGGLLTGFDLDQYHQLKQLKSPREAINRVHRGMIKSLINNINQRLETAFYANNPHYQELVKQCCIGTLPQSKKHTCVSPHFVLPHLIAKYLTSSQIDQYWDRLKRTIIDLQSDQLYGEITQVVQDHITKHTSEYGEKEYNVIKLLEEHEGQKETIKTNFQELHMAIMSFIWWDTNHDRKKDLFPLILKKLQLCYYCDRERTLNELEFLLHNHDSFEVGQYCTLLKYTRIHERKFSDSYANQYISSNVHDLMKIILANPETKIFEGTIISFAAIIAKAFFAADIWGDSRAIECFLINGSKWFELYEKGIKNIFPFLILKYQLFEALHVFFRSAKPRLRTECFKIAVDELITLETLSKTRTGWKGRENDIDKFFSQDLPLIYDDSTPLAAYNYCYQQFTEHNAPYALESLKSHFPQYAT